MKVLLLLLSLCAVAQSAEQPKQRIEVHGHRGARARYPENTLPAFQFALEAGADFLELDLSVTRDGVLVVSHDPHVNPEICRDKHGDAFPKPGPLLHALSLSEVKEYDCGCVKNPRFETQVAVPGTRMPALSEVFDMVRQSKHPNAKRIGFNIETKIFPEHPEYTIGPEEFARKAVEAFKQSGFFDRIVLQSFDPRTLVEARKIEPKITISLLVEDPKADLMGLCKTIRADIVSPDSDLVTPENVAEFHQAGIRVLPWTVNDPKDWQKLIEMNVDGIITDDPAALLKFLKR